MDVNPSCESAWVTNHCNYQDKIGIYAIYDAQCEDKLILCKMVNNKESLVESLHTIPHNVELMDIDIDYVNVYRR